MSRSTDRSRALSFLPLFLHQPLLVSFENDFAALYTGSGEVEITPKWQCWREKVIGKSATNKDH